MIESRPAVERGFIEYVFLCKVNDLNARLQRYHSGEDNELYNVLNMAAILRSLVDDQPLYVIVNRPYGLEIQVPQWVMSNWPGVRPDRTIASMYEKHCPPDAGDEIMPGGRWYPYSIQSYLNRELPGFRFLTNITPGQAIRLYANALGGVHLGGSISEKHMTAAVMDNSAMIFNSPPVAYAIASKIAPHLLTALQPLVDLVYERLKSAM